MFVYFSLYIWYTKVSTFSSSGLTLNGLVVKVLDSQSTVPCSKPLGGSKVDSAFHPFKVNQMSNRNFWELSGKM